MLTKLLAKNDPRIPVDAFVLLASTTGEVDLLEQVIDAANPDCSESKLANLLKKVCMRIGSQQEGGTHW